MSGAGKSTVAPLLAERLGFEWADLDRDVERGEGAGVASILRARGEPAFRDLEARALRRALGDDAAGPGRVLACGGGVVEREANRTLLERRAFVVWLLVGPEAAARRLDAAEAAQRPLLDGEPAAARLGELLDARRGLYERAADASVETEGRTAAEVAAAIEALWTGHRAPGSSGS